MSSTNIRFEFFPRREIIARRKRKTDDVRIDISPFFWYHLSFELVRNRLVMGILKNQHRKKKVRDVLLALATYYFF